MGTHVVRNKEPSRVSVVMGMMVLGGDGKAELSSRVQLKTWWENNLCRLRAFWGSLPGSWVLVPWGLPVQEHWQKIRGWWMDCSTFAVNIMSLWWKCEKPRSHSKCVQEKFLGEDSLQWCNKLQFAPNIKYYKCGWCNSISKSLRGSQ